jgi:hypothetical protein
MVCAGVCQASADGRLQHTADRLEIPIGDPRAIADGKAARGEITGVWHRLGRYDVGEIVVVGKGVDKQAADPKTGLP